MKNLILVIKDQLPLSRLIKNILNGNILGIFYKDSHINKNGTPKIGYSTKEKALFAVTKMKEKTNRDFSAYKCLFCDKYHIGKKYIKINKSVDEQ